MKPEEMYSTLNAKNFSPPQLLCSHSGVIFFFLWCLCSSVLWLNGVKVVDGTLISESSLQDCTSTALYVLNCKKKLVLSLSLPADLKPGAESINFISSAQESGSNFTVTFPKIELSLSRTAVFYRYPIFYLQDFNAAPYELIIDGSLANLCDDSATTAATCGLQKDSSGNIIPYSQGFCCDCSICSAIRVCKANARSALACNLLGVYSSASCLRFGDLWYSGFTMGSASIWFEIKLNLTSHKDNQTVQSSMLTLSPDQLGSSDALFGCEAQLVGTFDPSVEPQYFGDKMLFVPSMPLDSSIVKAGLPEYMILPDTMITIDGTECNKVGVSYYAFNSQGNRCQMSAGSCLENQLTNFRTSDMLRISKGESPQYMVAAYGEVSLQEFESENTATSKGGESENFSAPSPYLTYVSPAPPETLITVTINADTLQYVQSVASGKIIEAKLKQKSAEALSKGAVLEVEIQNTGDVVSEFTVDVFNCTGGVFPIPGQHISLVPHENVTLTYAVYMQLNVSTIASCQVSLLNALMVQISSMIVRWNVTTKDKNDGSQGSVIDGNGPTVTTTNKGSCKDCSLINALCIIEHACFSLGGGMLVCILALILAVVLLVCFRSPIFRMLRFCCCCCRAGGSQKRKVDRRGDNKKNVQSIESNFLSTQERVRWKDGTLLDEMTVLRSSGNLKMGSAEVIAGEKIEAEQYRKGWGENVVRVTGANEETKREILSLGSSTGGELHGHVSYPCLRRRVLARGENQEGLLQSGTSSLNSMRTFLTLELENEQPGTALRTDALQTEFVQDRSYGAVCDKERSACLPLKVPLRSNSREQADWESTMPY